jgi:hypothetical protein
MKPRTMTGLLLFLREVFNELDAGFCWQTVGCKLILFDAFIAKASLLICLQLAGKPSILGLYVNGGRYQERLWISFCRIGV